MAPAVTVDPAPNSERPLIEGLFQFYIYDFAEMYGPTEDFQVGPDGRYGAYPFFDGYWAEPERRPFVIRSRGQVAGFALLNRFSHRGAEVDNAVAEFFVMRPFRSLGVGAAAAHAIFTRYPGRWELAIASVNAGGRRFWPKVVASTPGARDIETVDMDEAGMFRRVLAFTVAPPGSQAAT